MKEIKMKDGKLIMPQDYIVLNPGDEGKCRLAYVLECRNSAKYGIPHFIYMTDLDGEGAYDQLEKEMYPLCQDKWPQFQAEVLNKKVEVIRDENNHFVNAEEHLASPYPGIFRIYRDDEPEFQEDAPDGVMILTK